MKWTDELNVKKSLDTKVGKVSYYSLEALKEKYPNIAKLPYSIKVLLEAVLRQHDGYVIQKNDIEDLANWQAKNVKDAEIPFKPARVIMQDFTGVPGVVDLAAMRDGLNDLGADPSKINPVLPVDLVIDHSVQVDESGSDDAVNKNAAKEFERNKERYEFLRWGSTAFSNFKVVPPATGIVHQVNLEYIAKAVQTREINGEVFAYPDSLVGTDSHTTMINGLGVVGWGVGGIEAEAVMLDQPVYMLTPEVVGFKLQGKLPEGATATDLVLTITQMLRAQGVVGKFVEFYGPGLVNLPLADRATIANMAPEYGATMGFFPVDGETLKYMTMTGRSEELIDLVKKYTMAQGLYRLDDVDDPEYTSNLELNMSTVVPSIAGPKRPQDRIELTGAKQAFHTALKENFKEEVPASITLPGGQANSRSPSYAAKESKVQINDIETSITHGSIVIAAITSCTNTSNPSVLVAAGLLAKKAAQKGLAVPAYVKTSLAPGSTVVTKYLEAAGLLNYLEELNFHVVGYGCTTCIGNSGPIRPEISKAINDNGLVATSILSGNRNFEGRIHSEVRANYLASPPLVVAYALAGTMDIDLNNEPIAKDKDGNNVYLKDIWPSTGEVQEAMHKAVRRDLFSSGYSDVYTGNEIWNNIQSSGGDIYNWEDKSTYIRKPSFFDGITLEVPKIQSVEGMKALAVLGDSVTTDHISPAGAIKADSPAGKWLTERGVEQKDFNTYGSRRGNHEIMIRGTFANIRIRNQLVPGVEGGFTVDHETGEQMAIYDAAAKYQERNRPLIVLAGKEYGTGSSRDWAAKGTVLLGVKAVLAQSYERIHRSNLIGMGVLPLQFKDGESIESHGLTGKETFSLPGLDDNLKPKQELEVKITSDSGERVIKAIVRIDTPVEVEYYRNGGILHTVLRKLGKS